MNVLDLREHIGRVVVFEGGYRSDESGRWVARAAAVVVIDGDDIRRFDNVTIHHAAVVAQLANARGLFAAAIGTYPCDGREFVRLTPPTPEQIAAAERWSQTRTHP